MFDQLKQAFVRHICGHDERGDIPGWVMITVMTIGVAAAISAVFGPAVTSYLGNALDQLQ